MTSPADDPQVMALGGPVSRSLGYAEPVAAAQGRAHVDQDRGRGVEG